MLAVGERRCSTQRSGRQPLRWLSFLHGELQDIRTVRQDLQGSCLIPITKEGGLERLREDGVEVQHAAGKLPCSHL